MGQTPYIIAKAQKASACLKLLTEAHGRPSREEESFNFAAPSVITNLGGGTLMGMSGGGVNISVAKEKETTAESGTGTAAAPAPKS